MNREKLTELGIPEDKIDNILSLFSESDAEREKLRDDLKERENQLATLKTFEGDNAALKSRIQDLEKENAARTEQFAKDLKAQRVQSAARLALMGREKRPHNIDLVMGLLKLDDLEIDDKGAVKGDLKEKIDAVEAQNPFLFETETKPRPGGIKPKAPNPQNTKQKEEEKSIGKELALRIINARKRAKGAKGGES